MRHLQQRAAVVVTAEDGTYGLGFTNHAGPVCEIVNGHFAHLLAGQDATATGAGDRVG